MMWGGGVKGHVYGATADERPLMAIKTLVDRRFARHHLHHYGNQPQDRL